MKNETLLTILISALLTISTPSCAMSKKEANNSTVGKNHNSLNFKEYKTSAELQTALQKSYPNGIDLDKIVNDLNLNKQSKVNDKTNNDVILYHLYDGSKNIHGYNYWKISIRVNAKNQIEQISVNPGDYQGS
jgi:hypothetical protein